MPNPTTPTDEPNAAADLPVEARDPDSVAAVMDGVPLDDGPDGPARTVGGNARNAAIDLGLDAGEANAAAEARTLATGEEAEAHPS